MKLAWLELRRQPGRFAVIGVALMLLVLLMLFLGKLLDGLFLGSTGAIRIQEADGFVYSGDARQSLQRSQIDDDTLRAMAEIDGVDGTGGLGVSLLGVGAEAFEEPVNGAIIGYANPSGRLPVPPAPGEGLADSKLEELGVSLGDTVVVGPSQVPITIVGWVDDSNYLLQNSVWVDGATWRGVQNANRPDAAVAPDEWQIGVYWVTAGADVDAVAASVAELTGGEVLTETEAAFAIPGVPEQSSTLSAIIYVTAFVVALVVALFFALLTLERAGLYAVLKATGASNGTLMAGLILQAVVVALVAYAVGGLLSFLLGLVVPAGIPLEYSTSRAIFIMVAVVVAAVVGGLASFRRIIRIDPASAIGAGL